MKTIALVPPAKNQVLAVWKAKHMAVDPDASCSKGRGAISETPHKYRTRIPEQKPAHLVLAESLVTSVDWSMNVLDGCPGSCRTDNIRKPGQFVSFQVATNFWGRLRG